MYASRSLRGQRLVPPLTDGCEMKSYLATTGLLFLALAVAHVIRVTQEQHLATDPFFIITTVISIAMAAWAFRLYRRVTARLVRR